MATTASYCEIVAAAGAGEAKKERVFSNRLASDIVGPERMAKLMEEGDPLYDRILSTDAVLKMCILEREAIARGEEDYDVGWEAFLREECDCRRLRLIYY